MKVGIGTSTPSALLALHAVGGMTNTSTNLFTIASSTSAFATSTLYAINNMGSTTAANGFNITAGCYAVSGTCLVSGNSAASGSAGAIQLASGTGSFTSASAFTYSTTTNVLTLGPALDTIRMFSTTTGTGATHNLFIGNNAGNFTTDTSGGGLNTGVGSSVLSSLTNGYGNAAFGVTALNAAQGATNNAAFGNFALLSLQSGTENVAMGLNAGRYVQTGTGRNTLIGGNAGRGGSGQSDFVGNVAVGNQSLINAFTAASYNTALGYQAGYDITTGAHNILIGEQQTSGTSVTSASYNIFIGNDLQLATSSNGTLNIGNMIFGSNVGSSTNYAAGGVGIGTTTNRYGGSLTKGLTLSNALVLASSTALSTTSLALYNNNGTLYWNGTSVAAAINQWIDTNGTSTLASLNGSGFIFASTSRSSLSVGVNSLKNFNGGLYSTAVGFGALNANTTGNRNTSFGYNAANANTGSNNTTMGAQAMEFNTGSNNVAIGFAANGYFAAGGTSNGVSIGYNAGFYQSGNYSISIGSNASPATASVIGGLSIGNVIFGTGMNSNPNFNQGELGSNGTIGISSSTPFAKFAIHAAPLDTLTTLFAIGSSTSNSTSTLFVVKNTGNVGIGTSSPLSKLSVTGSVCLDLNSDGACTDNTSAVSDARLKTNVNDLQGGLSTIHKLHPVTFNWKGDNELGFPVGNAASVGFLAQEVEAVLQGTDIVETDTSGTKLLSYDKLTAVLTRGVQELDQKISGTSEVSSTTSALEAFGNGWLGTMIRDFLAWAGNGVQKIYALVVHTNEVHAKEKLCVGEEGSETCVTKQQLDSLLQSTAAAAAPVASPSGEPVVTPPESAEEASTTPPSVEAVLEPAPEAPVSEAPPADPAPTIE